MNEILDDDLATDKKPVSLYGKFSNLPAAIVILGALFKVLHWPYGNLMLLIGICGHFGIELGYALALRFKSKLNNRRLAIATFFFVFLSGFWRVRLSELIWMDFLVFTNRIVWNSGNLLSSKKKRSRPTSIMLLLELH